MIEIGNLTKRFGKTEALSSVSMSLHPSSVYALIGPNGSGKTTLLKSVLGLVKPDMGSILLNNRSILGKWDYRQVIGYMPQISRYPDNMTAAQIIAMVRDVRQQTGNTDNELYEKLEVHKFENKRMHSLSGGMRQKVGASLAFMFHPQVIILDEPTAGLDPVSSEILKQKITDAKNNGKLIIITSHILSELDDLISHVIYLNEGRKTVDLPIGELRKQTGCEKLTQAIAVVMKSELHD